MSVQCLLFIIIQAVTMQFIIAENLHGQNLKDTRVTLELEKERLTEIFKVIEDKTDFSFVYPEEVRNDRSKFSLSTENESLESILRRLRAKAKLKFKVSNYTITAAFDPRIVSTSVKRELPVHIDPITVTGVVSDEQGDPLPGASVLVKGTGIGITTDADGRFALQVDDVDAVLVFSFIGYETQEMVVGNQTNIVITLRPDSKTLQEVVVVGYGTLKKTSVTSAISKVENKLLDQFPAGRPESALVGRMAGVNITQVRSIPGESPTITIRGPGSISASNNPLIVIDGFPGGSFDNINLNDVESVEVLKDASAAAIYGSRGSGGVIIVTTKKGRSGKPQLNLNAYYGIANPIIHGEDAWVSPGQEFYDYSSRYSNRDFAWVGGDTSIPLWGDPARPALYQVNPVIKEGSWNWEDILLDPAPIQNYNISVSGNTDKVNYYVSGTLKDEEGTMKSTNFKQYSFRANVDVAINSRFSTGIMISPNYSERQIYPYGGGGLQNHVKMPPFLSPERQPDGSYLKPLDYWGSVVSGGLNPLAIMEGTHFHSNAFNNIGEMYAVANILDGLKFRSSLGINISYGTTDNFQESSAANVTRGSASDSRNMNWINENVLSYDRIFNGSHSFTGIIGASYQKNTSRFSRLGAVPGSYANETIWTLNNAIISPGSSNTSKSQWGLASYFSRINYAFKDKYLLSASIRTDGSSRFGPENRWGYFPSASAAWRISEEDFLKSVTMVNELKLRGSYGVVGNFNIGDFQYLGTIGGNFYSPDDQLIQGQAQASFGNSELKWERTESFDVGIEVSLFNNRLNFVFDYYDKLTRDLLYNVSIPSISGFTNTIVNVGDISNKGIEVEINTKNLTGPFKWETSFNYSRNRNAVTSLGGGVDQIINTHARGMGWILRVGEPMFSFYGHESKGVLLNAEDVANYPIIAGQMPGTTKYEDLNNDGVITPADRKILGNFQPDFFMGMVNDFSWNNFDLTIAMQSSIGGKIYNLENLYYQGPQVCALLRAVVENQWWSEAEPGDGKTPAASLAALQYVGNTDYYLEDASFLAIRNINLGYTLPRSILERLKLTNMRVYVSMSNALMLTKEGFNGYNPEGYTQGGINGINSMPGLNLGSEPINRTIVLGLNMNF